MTTKGNASCFRMHNPLVLSFSAQLGFELCNRSEHMEQEPTRCISRIERLIKNVELDALALKFFRDLAQVQRRASEAVETSNDKRIAFSYILQARCEAWAFPHGPALLLLKDLVTVLEPVMLDGQALTDRTNPRVANQCHMTLRMSHNL